MLYLKREKLSLCEVGLFIVTALSLELMIAHYYDTDVYHIRKWAGFE